MWSRRYEWCHYNIIIYLLEDDRVIECGHFPTGEFVGDFPKFNCINFWSACLPAWPQNTWSPFTLMVIPETIKIYMLLLIAEITFCNSRYLWFITPINSTLNVAFKNLIFTVSFAPIWVIFQHSHKLGLATPEFILLISCL